MNQLLLLLLALASSALGAFVPPTEGPVPFRRDKLPVDVATMTKLSRQLVVLAGQVSPGGPEDRRTLAQMMALSQALDPSNDRVRDLVEQLAEGGELPRGEDRDVDLAQARVWDLLGWLEQPEAGRDGQALGSCLSDVLLRADPTHPLSKERAGKRERGAWDGWVANVDRFRNAKPVTLPTQNENKPDVAKLVLRRVSATMPIRYWSKGNQQQVILPVEFELKAWIDQKGDGFVFQLPGESWKAAKQRPNVELTEFLKSRHGSLPKGLCMRLRLPEDVKMDYSRDGKSLTALLPVMAHAVFSGVPPKGMVLAALDDEGAVVGPSHFWETIRALSDGESEGRLIIPDSMRDHLPPLLALGKAEFFFRYQVLVAANQDELLAMSSSQPGKESVDGLAAFEVVKQAREKRSLGSFVTYPTTQQRLGQIVGACPAHASARMLALRGTSGWPKRLEEKFYAMEVRSALAPMGDVLRGRWGSIKTTSLLAAGEECRDRLGAVEKLYSSVAERNAVYDPAVSTAKTIGGLVADLKRLDEDEGWRQPSLVKKTYAGYVDTIARLTQFAADGNEYPVPDRDRQR